MKIIPFTLKRLFSREPERVRLNNGLMVDTEKVNTFNALFPGHQGNQLSQIQFTYGMSFEDANVFANEMLGLPVVSRWN